MINEIIIRKAGNTLCGNTATKALYTPLPAVHKLDESEAFHVFEWDGASKAWIHRASQSTRALALAYIPSGDESRVLVWREELGVPA